jgi:hypothetical protein
MPASRRILQISFYSILFTFFLRKLLNINAHNKKEGLSISLVKKQEENNTLLFLLEFRTGKELKRQDA